MSLKLKGVYQITEGKKEMKQRKKKKEEKCILNNTAYPIMDSHIVKNMFALCSIIRGKDLALLCIYYTLDTPIVDGLFSHVPMLTAFIIIIIIHSVFRRLFFFFFSFVTHLFFWEKIIQ